MTIAGLRRALIQWHPGLRAGGASPGGRVYLWLFVIVITAASNLPLALAIAAFNYQPGGGAFGKFRCPRIVPTIIPPSDENHRPRE